MDLLAGLVDHDPEDLPVVDRDQAPDLVAPVRVRERPAPVARRHAVQRAVDRVLVDHSESKLAVDVAPLTKSSRP